MNIGVLRAQKPSQQDRNSNPHTLSSDENCFIGVIRQNETRKLWSSWGQREWEKGKDTSRCLWRAVQMAWFVPRRVLGSRAVRPRRDLGLVLPCCRPELDAVGRLAGRCWRIGASHHNSNARTLEAGKPVKPADRRTGARRPGGSAQLPVLRYRSESRHLQSVRLLPRWPLCSQPQGGNEDASPGRIPPAASLPLLSSISSFTE
ncbi:hypothetical protein F5884DRAFT_223930 [Xylogone sp. PMI_703]|nr:hypothetical protein F5884DRAFT_223930 [Xylogone sp. PMI_703]